MRRRAALLLWALAGCASQARGPRPEELPCAGPYLSPDSSRLPGAVSFVPRYTLASLLPPARPTSGDPALSEPLELGEIKVDFSLSRRLHDNSFHWPDEPDPEPAVRPRLGEAIPLWDELIRHRRELWRRKEQQSQFASIRYNQSLMQGTPGLPVTDRCADQLGVAIEATINESQQALDQQCARVVKALPRVRDEAAKEAAQALMAAHCGVVHRANAALGDGAHRATPTRCSQRFVSPGEREHWEAAARLEPATTPLGAHARVMAIVTGAFRDDEQDAHFEELAAPSVPAPVRPFARHHLSFVGQERGLRWLRANLADDETPSQLRWFALTDVMWAELDAGRPEQALRLAAEHIPRLQDEHTTELPLAEALVLSRGRLPVAIAVPQEALREAAKNLVDPSVGAPPRWALHAARTIALLSVSPEGRERVEALAAASPTRRERALDALRRLASYCAIVSPSGCGPRPPYDPPYREEQVRVRPGKQARPEFEATTPPLEACLRQHADEYLEGEYALSAGLTVTMRCTPP